MTDPAQVGELLQANYERREDRVAELLAARPQLTLFDAAAVGELPQLRARLLADAAAVHSRSPDGFTALHLAAYFGQPAAAAELLSHGADPGLATDDGRLPEDMRRA